MATIGRVTTGSPLVRPVQSAEAEKVLGRIRQAVEDGRRAADGLRQSMAAERKARARAVVERLKQQLTQLSQTVALNPKAAARLLRQMERQLADAVSEYAKAGGSKSEVAATPKASPAASAASDPAKTDSTPTADTAASAADAAKAEARDAAPARAGMTSGQASDAAAAASAAEREKARNAYLSIADARTARAPDEKFIRDARQIHEQMKSLMRAMLMRIEDERERERNASAFAKNAEVIEKGLAEIEEWGAEPAAPPVSPMAPVSLAV